MRHKHHCAIVLTGLVGFSATAFAASSYFVDELRGLDFGTSQSTLTDLVHHGARGGLQVFWRRSDSLLLIYRGVPLREILYAFRDGRLEAVELWAASLGCDDSMLRALKTRFGEPQVSLGGDTNQPTAPEADCQRLGPAGTCEAYKFEGFPKDANAKGIVGWYTRYGSIQGKHEQCRQRVQFSRSSRTRAERDDTKKKTQDALKELWPGVFGSKPGKR